MPRRLIPASIDVLRAGLLSSVQDLGRHGHAGIGVGRAGAMDPIAACLANWLVGNDGGAAVIEITLSGPRLRFTAATTIALCGADADLSLDAKTLPTWRPVPAARGSVLDCGALRRGARLYLAVAGGIDVAAVLGSRSVDINAGLGPCGGRALRSGDRLGLVSTAPRLRRAPAWSLAPWPWFDPSSMRPLRILRGSHYDQLDPASRAALTTQRFHVAAQSNRVGTRLDGTALRLAQPLELVSAPVARGTLQLPPGGQPIMLGAEHPTTGGYPRIAHLIETDQAHLAQRRPGDALVLQLIGMDEADALQRRRERALARLQENVRQRLRELRCDAST